MTTGFIMFLLTAENVVHTTSPRCTAVVTLAAANRRQAQGLSGGPSMWRCQAADVVLVRPFSQRRHAKQDHHIIPGGSLRIISVIHPLVALEGPGRRRMAVDQYPTLFAKARQQERSR